MKSSNFDVIVVGLGAMGSAAVYHLSHAGLRVLGLDRFEPPHDLGSSHGLTRIIREAYFEHPLYVPLVQRAYELWGELERASNRKLLLRTGGIMIGRADGVLVSGARRSAEQHHLRHELLSTGEIRRRFPVLEPGADMVGVWEPRAGILFPELAISAHLHGAAKAGAQLHLNESVTGWAPTNSGVRVSTPKGTYTAPRLVFSSGAWLGSLVPELKLPLRIERQVLYWFKPHSQAAGFAPDHCPIHLWEYEPHRFFYGFPDLGDGAKVAIHHQGDTTDPARVRREVGTDEIESMRALLRRFIPSADGTLSSSAVCMYTNTPDEHFIFAPHPDHAQVLIVSPCSGHGFKFSPTIGELTAQWACDKSAVLDLSLFRLDRFKQGVVR